MTAWLLAVALSVLGEPLPSAKGGDACGAECTASTQPHEAPRARGSSGDTAAYLEAWVRLETLRRSGADASSIEEAQTAAAELFARTPRLTRQTRRGALEVLQAELDDLDARLREASSTCGDTTFTHRGAETRRTVLAWLVSRLRRGPLPRPTGTSAP